MARPENPVLIARLGGVFYLTNVALGPGLVAIGKVYVANDAMRTASNLFAHLALFQFGFSANLIAIAGYIGVTGLFYVLFKPVNREVSLVAACFSLVACVILAMSSLFYFAPLMSLAPTPGASPSALQWSQQAMMLMFKLYSQGFMLSFAFFGFYCLLIGYLIYKSTFLPRILGFGMVAAGLGGITFLAPLLARAAFPYVMIGSIGEMALTFWLIAFGVNRERWLESYIAAHPDIRNEDIGKG